MRERDEYCRTLRDGMGWILPQYKNVLYSDAYHFAHNMRRKKKCYRRRGRDENGKLYRDHLDKVHKRIDQAKVSFTVSAMIGWNFKSKLVFMDRHIDGDDYVEQFLDPVVRPFFEKQRARAAASHLVCKWAFQEDNERAHGTKSVDNASNDFKNEYKIKQLKPRHSANSLDLNFIERIWRKFKQRVKKRKPTNQADLRRYIEEEWEKITVQDINKEIEKMVEAVSECIDRDGDITSF
ncbi:hypothetical protein BDZ45DRAFT_685821 [Acephala macrosclerotiorum]|nr:hypothetical protein BDZ45DRAFT_685821 [Acephala macrosclerotiorum]